MTLETIYSTFREQKLELIEVAAIACAISYTDLYMLHQKEGQTLFKGSLTLEGEEPLELVFYTYHPKTLDDKKYRILLEGDTGKSEHEIADEDIESLYKELFGHEKMEQDDEALRGSEGEF